MKLLHYIIVIILALAAGWAGSHWGKQTGTIVVAQKETAYERVMRTKTLRCGYNVWPPAVQVEPNSGKVQGFIVDLVETAARAVNLKVEWTTQVGWSSFPLDLKNGRIDAMCAGAWAVKESAPFVAYTRPIFYNPVYAYAHADDTRFDNTLAVLNAPNYKIGAIDGAMSDVIARQDFAQAKIIGLPQLSDPSQVLTDLSMHKSDVVFMEGSFAAEFIAKNPNKIKRISDMPYRSFPSPLLATSIDDARLAIMFDTIIGEMQLQGTIDKALNKYKADRALFIPPIKPY
jgi:ABC-type amino acid transport substrate-binding protein